MRTLYLDVTTHQIRPGNFTATVTPKCKAYLDKRVTGHGRTIGEAIEDFEYRAAYSARRKHNAHCRIVAAEVQEAAA